MPFSKSRDDSGIEWPRMASFDLRGLMVLHCSSRIDIHFVPNRILCLFFGHQTVHRNSCIWNLTWPDRNRKPLWSMSVNISLSMSTCWILIGLRYMQYRKFQARSNRRKNQRMAFSVQIFHHRMIKGYHVQVAQTAELLNWICETRAPRYQE